MLGQEIVPGFSGESVDRDARRRQLRLILWLRLAAMVGQLFIVGWVHLKLQIPLPWQMMFVATGGLAAITLVSALWLRQGWPVKDAMLMGQLLVDVAALSVFLYASGGAHNPFAVLYVVPVALAAALLPALHVAGMVAITIGCYLLLARFNIPLPHLHHYHLGDFFYLHMQGMLVAYSTSALLVAGMGWWMAASVRQRDVALGRLRERQQLDDAMARIGWQAAHLAHELSTPLSTMAVVVHELREEYGKPKALVEALEVMHGEVKRCAQAIDRVMQSVGDPRAGNITQVMLLSYLKEQWERAGFARLQCEWGGVPQMRVVMEETVGEVLLNLWRNAEAAGADVVRMSAEVKGNQLQLIAEDDGVGIAPEILEQLGMAPVASLKGEGHGVGLWLGRMALRRWGGDIALENKLEGKGARVRVILPLVEAVDG